MSTPDLRPSNPGPVENGACSCGSGKKYKQCCYRTRARAGSPATALPAEPPRSCAPRDVLLRLLREEQGRWMRSMLRDEFPGPTDSERQALSASAKEPLRELEEDWLLAEAAAEGLFDEALDTLPPAVRAWLDALEDGNLDLWTLRPDHILERLAADREPLQLPCPAGRDATAGETVIARLLELDTAVEATLWRPVDQEQAAALLEQARERADAYQDDEDDEEIPAWVVREGCLVEFLAES